MRHLIRLCIDQGLSSISLFIFSIALARQFGTTGFSTYAIALSSSLMVMAIFNSAYIEPTVFKESEGLSRKTTAKHLFILALGISIACAFFIDQSEIVPVTIFILGSSSLYAVRRIKALSGEQNKLTLISITSFTLTMIALGVLSYKQAPLSLWLISYGSIGIIYVLFIPSATHEKRISVKPDISSLCIAIMFWICSNYFFYYLPALDRASESGQLRIIYTLFMPILQAGTIAGSIYISKKEHRKLVLPITIAMTLTYGLALIAIGQEAIYQITKIPVSRTELIYATALAAANSTAGLFSISMRMQGLIKPLLLSSSVSAITLISLSFFADNLNTVMLLITVSFLISITLSKAIRYVQK